MEVASKKCGFEARMIESVFVVKIYNSLTLLSLRKVFVKDEERQFDLC